MLPRLASPASQKKMAPLQQQQLHQSQRNKPSPPTRCSRCNANSIASPRISIVGVFGTSGQLGYVPTVAVNLPWIDVIEAFARVYDAHAATSSPRFRCNQLAQASACDFRDTEYRTLE